MLNVIGLEHQVALSQVKPGQIILAADGSLSLKVKSTGSDHVVTEAEFLDPDMSERHGSSMFCCSRF